jgi:hypothetical protein
MIPSSLKGVLTKYRLSEEAAEADKGGPAADKEERTEDEIRADDIADLLDDVIPAKKEEKQEDKKEKEEKTEESDKDQDKDKDKEKKEEKDKKEEDPVVKALKDQVEAMQAELAKIKGDKKDDGKKDDKKETISSPEIDEVIKDMKEAADEFFTDDKEFDAIVEDKTAMNKVLSKVKHSAVEYILKSLPAVITNLVGSQVVMAMKTAQFYKDNSDLVEHRKFVEEVATDLATKNPAITLEDLFDKGQLEEEVRKRKGLQKKAETKEKMKSQEKQEKEEKKEEEKKPGFARTGGRGERSSSEKDDRSEKEKAIDDLIDD